MLAVTKPLVTSLAVHLGLIPTYILTGYNSVVKKSLANVFLFFADPGEAVEPIGGRELNAATVAARDVGHAGGQPRLQRLRPALLPLRGRGPLRDGL